jgi:hypothetical protein
VPAPTRLSSTPRLASFCGLAQRRARDPQLLGQRPLGRQLGAALELGALDQLQQLLGNAVGQADGGHGVWQEFQVVGIIHGNT